MLLALALLAAPACSTAPQAPDKLSAQEVRADFEDLYAGLKAAHYDLYARRSQPEYDALYAEMRDGIRAAMTMAEAEVYFQKFSAFGKVAHSKIAFPADAWEAFRAGGGKAIPLGIRFMGEKLMITDDYSGSEAELRGTQIVSINGMDAAEVETRLRRHVSADNDYLAHTILEFSFVPVFWLEFGAPETFSIVVEDAGGGRRTVDLPALARDELNEGGDAPMFELDRNERRYEIDGRVGYLRPGPFYNNEPDAADPWDPTAFRTFIDEAFTAFIGADLPAVLIDLRANPGGDNSFSDPMLAWFADEPFRFASHFYIRASEATIASNAKRVPEGDTTSVSFRMGQALAAVAPGEVVDFDLGDSLPREGERYDGKVYLLIDRHSYSNTVTVAALAQDYGFATVLGEETSDLATTYGAMEQFTLPRSGIVVDYPKALIVCPNGGMEARGVIPDVAIPSPLLPTHDVQLEQALDWVNEALDAR